MRHQKAAQQFSATSDVVVKVSKCLLKHPRPSRMHLPLQNERQPIPDVPAVYFVRGSEEAVAAVAADAERGLYDAMHLNFSPPLTPPLLEALAKHLVGSGSAHRVSKVPPPPPPHPPHCVRQWEIMRVQPGTRMHSRAFR